MSESRTRKSAKNFLFAFANLLINLILQFVSRTVFIHTLGVTYLGVNGLFTNVISLLNMADLGISTAVLYSFYKPLAENDFNKINAFLGYYKKIYYTIAGAIMAIGIGIIPWLKYIVNLEQSVSHIYLYYILLVVNTAVSYLFVYKTCVLVADQKQYIMTWYQMLTNVARTLVQVVALLMYKSYTIYLIVAILATIVQNIVSTREVDKRYPIQNRPGAITKEDRNYIKENISSMFAYKIASQIFNGTDNILLSMMFGTIQVGLYSNYLLIVQYVSNIVGNLFSATTASIGNSIVVDQPKRRLEIFKTMQIVSCVIGTFFSCELLLLVNDFIGCWLGKEYTFSTIVVVSIVLNFLMDCGFQPIWCYRNAAGIFVKLKYIMLVAAALNIIFSIGLGHLLGISGVFFATSLSRLLSYFWYEPRILFRDFFETSEKTYYMTWLKYIVSTVFLSIAQYVMFSSFVVNNWAMWIAKGALSSLISMTCIYLLYRKDEEFQEFLKKILSIAKLKR